VGSLLFFQIALDDQVNSAQANEVRQQIDTLQWKAGLQVQIQIAIDPIKDALIESAKESDAVVLIIGRSPHSRAHGRLRDLTYSVVRDSPFSVLSV
jgi:nucleotide-binding universal stress UspA family protein